MSQIFYMNGFNVAPDEIVYLNLSNPSGQLKPGGSVFNAGGFILSPDGSKIVYHLESGSSARLRRGDINSSSNFAIQNTAVLTSGTTGTDREPTFAPDNYQVAFVRANQIYTINLNGTNQMNISQNSFQDRHPDWSPDGGQIAFASDRNGDWDIYLASPDNFSQAQRLTQVAFKSMSELTWSPDGTRIAFIGRETNTDVLNLHIVNVANGSIQNLTSSGSQERSPSWSPNGDQLAFVRLIRAWRIYTIRPDGSDETFLVQPSGSDIRQLSWRLLPPNHNGSSYCPIGVAANDEVVATNPISLRLGEKREQVTDLALTTPAGTLDFTRLYRQSKQDDYQGMGLGWTHNHDLFIDDSVSNKLIVSLPNAGQAQFSRVGSTNQYNGDPGSNSVIVVNPASTDERYTLTASDQSIYIYDDQKRLRSRQWANGETWTYNYYTTGYADGMLQEVDDGYGRKLQFVYVDNFGEYDHLQLWRVGDQETSGLDGTTPGGRYIEFVYTNEKLDGMPIIGAKALLHQIQDVRGQTWTYRYYGQEAGETDSTQTNFLVEVVSPEVDIDGDETPDISIVLKHLTYTLSWGEVRHILQERGFLEGDNPNTALLRTAYTFLRMQTTEEIVDTQRMITYRFAGGMLAGSKDAAGNGGSQLITANYRPAKQIDANDNDTTLNWSSNGKLLNSVRDALDHETQFVYDMQERLLRSTDAQGRITEYTYGNSNVPRQPTVIQVFDGDGITLLRQQEFDYDSKGRTLEERTINPADGTKVIQKTTRTYHTSGTGNGLLASVTQVDVEDAGNNQSTSYTYDSAGRVIKTQRSSLFGSCDISFTVYDLAGNVVASICNYDPGASPDPADATEAAALYDPAEPDKNRVTTHRYDEMGRQVATTVNAGADFAQTSLTLYDALDRVVRTITHFVDDDYAAPGGWVFEAGIWKDEPAGTPISHGGDKTENLIADTAYNARGLTRMRRDGLGNVTLFGYDDADRLVKIVQNASDPDYDNDYSSGDPDLSSYVEDTTATDVDIITEQAYNPVGNLIKAVNPLGITDLTAYDALNRPVEVVNSASDPDYNLLGYGSFSQYVFSDAPDRDLRRTTSYDALGRTLQTGQIIAKTGAAETWVYNRQVYDALGRQRLSVRNYIDQGEDPALWVWDEAEARWEQSDGTPIQHGEHNDQNLISEQVYDEAGRVRFSRDMAGTKTWQVYDGLGRQVKQIAGCTYSGGSPAPEDSGYVGAVDDPAADVISETFFDVDGRVNRTRRLLRYDAGEDELIWAWTLIGYDALGRQVKTVENASDPDYDLGADPDLSAYTPSSQPDEDLITETHYDAEGRVYKTTDTLSSVTLYGFDRAGRQVKIIQNASDPDYDVAADPDLSSYTPSAEPDEDIISQTAYDVAGRVVKVTDALGHVTLYGYDRAGRQVKVIQHASDPDYDISADPDLSGYTGDNPDADQDRSTETAYDKAGRTIRMTDAQGNVTLTGYDRAGRQVKVIQNASDPDYDVLSDPDLSGYVGDNPDSDQDRSIDQQLTLDALQRALEQATPFIFHSDQGSQYCAWLHTEQLLERGVKISMSDKASPTQNGLVERFMRTVKEEHIDYTEYHDFEDAYRQLKHWLEVTYMTERVHQSLGYVTPAEFEMAALATPCYPLLNPG